MEKEKSEQTKRTSWYLTTLITIVIISFLLGVINQGSSIGNDFLITGFIIAAVYFILLYIHKKGKNTHEMSQLPE